jgi:hypothetical protein
MKRARVNLVLVLWTDHPATESDLRRIVERVPQINPEVQAFLVRHHKIDQLKLFRIWSQPTLSVSFLNLQKRKLLPGRFLCGHRLYKHGEYMRLDAAGVPLPQWTIISPDTRLDPTMWGPYVVEKPAAGRRGAHVRIRKTTRVRYVPPDSLPKGHHGRDGPMLAQRFIYTGEWPVSYRVVTLFGKVLLCYRQMSRARGHPLKGRWTFNDTGGVSIVSNTKDMVVEFANDADVIALAERAHRDAFGDFPMLGFDMVRDAETGAVYVLECHAHGSWLFTADIAARVEKANNIDFRSQFDPLEKAAHILAQETMLRAAVCWPPLAAINTEAA